MKVSLSRVRAGEYRDENRRVVVRRLEDGYWHLVIAGSWYTTQHTKRAVMAYLESLSG